MSIRLPVQSRLVALFLTGIVVQSGILADEVEGVAKRGLSWDQQTLQVPVSLKETRAEGWFVFTNVADDPIKLLKVESDCDCMVTQTDLIVYYPGESGVLVAMVEVPADTKQLDKAITVTFQISGQQPQVDVLRFMIQRTNDSQESKEAKLNAANPDPAAAREPAGKN